MLQGGLLIAGLVGLGALIFFLDDLIGAFDRTYTIVAVVPDAPGLAPGSPVWVGGREVGEVTTVGFLPAGTDTLDRVSVTLKLPRRLQPQIRTDSRVRLTSAALIGQRVVDIVPGTSAARELAPGDTLRLKVELTSRQVTRHAAAVRVQLDTLLARASVLAPAARARMEEAERAAIAMEGALAEARRLSSDLRMNRGPALLSDPVFTTSLQAVRQHAAELSAEVDRLRAGAAGMGDVGAALARLQARADTLGARLDAAAAILRRPDGLAGRLQQDSALIHATHAARAALDSLMAEVRQEPLRFVF
jgi:phospholipid/cholesterol/gamma-HCH transport system substrate-binding protein